VSKLAGRSALTLLGLAGAALLPARGALPGIDKPAAEGARFLRFEGCDRSREIETLLRRGEWSAAETQARAAIADEVKPRENAFAALVAQLAVAVAGQGRDEEALWTWQVAQAMGWRREPADYGAAGALLAGSRRRGIDEPPAGLVVRREGDGGGAFTPARKLAGAAVTLPGAWRRFPRGIRAQVVVDREGRVREPAVATSTFSALTYAVLETMRDWRFAPARADGEPVASFYDLELPAVRPLEQVVDFRHGPLAGPLEWLKSGRYREADRRLDTLWAGAVNDAEPTRALLGVALALRALAAAGMGREDQAICRFQAAQTLEPRLYGADLAAFGAAGALLMRHPWRAPQAECGQGTLSPPFGAGGGGEPTKPEPINRRLPAFPEYARQSEIHGAVVVNSVLSETGVPRWVVLQQPGPSAGLDASALDAICDWRFKPATLEGRPVRVIYTLNVNFEVRGRR
jgi:TonB family protein